MVCINDDLMEVLIHQPSDLLQAPHNSQRFSFGCMVASFCVQKLLRNALDQPHLIDQFRRGEYCSGFLSYQLKEKASISVLRCITGQVILPGGIISITYSTPSKVFVIGQIVSQFIHINRGAPPHFLLLLSAIKQVLKCRTLKRERKRSRRNTEE